MGKIQVFSTSVILCISAAAVIYWNGGPTSMNELKDLVSSNTFLWTVFGVLTFAATLHLGCGYGTTEFSKCIGNFGPNGSVCKITGAEDYRQIDFHISCKRSDQSVHCLQKLFGFLGLGAKDKTEGHPSSNHTGPSTSATEPSQSYPKSNKPKWWDNMKDKLCFWRKEKPETGADNENLPIISKDSQPLFSQLTKPFTPEGEKYSSQPQHNTNEVKPGLARSSSDNEQPLNTGGFDPDKSGHSWPTGASKEDQPKNSNLGTPTTQQNNLGQQDREGNSKLPMNIAGFDPAQSVHSQPTGAFKEDQPKNGDSNLGTPTSQPNNIGLQDPEGISKFGQHNPETPSSESSHSGKGLNQARGESSNKPKLWENLKDKLCCWRKEKPETGADIENLPIKLKDSQPFFSRPTKPFTPEAEEYSSQPLDRSSSDNKQPMNVGGFDPDQSGHSQLTGASKEYELKNGDSNLGTPTTQPNNLGLQDPEGISKIPLGELNPNSPEVGQIFQDGLSGSESLAPGAFTSDPGTDLDKPVSETPFGQHNTETPSSESGLIQAPGKSGNLENDDANRPSCVSHVIMTAIFCILFTSAIVVGSVFIFKKYITA